MINHQNNFSTNLTSNQIAGVTTTPLDSIPTIEPDFYLAFDATNVNSHYEVVRVTSKTATNVNHAATSYAHTTDEEVRMVVPAEELDEIGSGWRSLTATIPTRASADDPTYVLTFAGVDLTSSVSVGMKIKWTQNSSVRYGFVTAISFSTDTTLTLYGGTDYDVDDTATYAISDVYFSSQKAPFGFPLDPDKWSVKTINTTNTNEVSPTAGAWYNTGSISIDIPIGLWLTEYFVTVSIADGSDTWINMAVTLSTSDNSESDTEFTGLVGGKDTNNAEHAIRGIITRHKNISLTVKDTYYLINKTTESGITQIQMLGANAPTIIRATIAYL